MGLRRIYPPLAFGSGARNGSLASPTQRRCRSPRRHRPAAAPPTRACCARAARGPPSAQPLPPAVGDRDRGAGAGGREGDLTSVASAASWRRCQVSTSRRGGSHTRTRPQRAPRLPARARRSARPAAAHHDCLGRARDRNRGRPPERRPLGPHRPGMLGRAVDDELVDGAPSRRSPRRCGSAPPPAPDVLQVGAHRIGALVVEPVEPTRPPRAVRHQSCLLEQPQMAGHGGAADRRRQ